MEFIYSGMSKVVYVIFGATGDLAYRKLIPSLQQIHKKKSLDFEVIAIGRKEYTQREYIDTITKDNNVIEEDFLEHLHYYQMKLTEVEDYSILMEYLLTFGSHNQWIYYFAVAPELFIHIAHGFQHCDNMKNHCKVIIEKPFGSTQQHVEVLNQTLEQVFGKNNIYRIDHYLGKEMIQNIIALRFGNYFFKGMWNKEYIDSIEIIANESLGILNRGSYYEQSGALRDMVQNHLFQLLTLLLMDEKEAMNNLQHAQLVALKELEPMKSQKQLMRGQYKEYVNESMVSPTSNVETFISMILFSSNPRFSGIPLYLQTGKKMNEKKTEVTLYFKQPYNKVYPLAPQPHLTIGIDPTEGISFQFNVKNFLSNELEEVEMNYCQSCRLDYHEQALQAYERLLVAAAHHDHQSFANIDFIIEGWKIIDAISMKNDKSEWFIYNDGNELEEKINNFKKSIANYQR